MAAVIACTGTLAQADVLSDDLALDEQAISHAQLEGERGRADADMLILGNTAEQGATLQHNVLTSAATGTNIVGEGAFNGASGISSLIQNTGNQVLIQQTTQVNVLLRQ